ncbi:MAG: hypothetical protein QNL91_00685 [Candidatus Krumholzibacteria bacterium]|nr:hypothetical protein [Candidatus Krumholzibacteria bacterium]
MKIQRTVIQVAMILLIVGLAGCGSQPEPDTGFTATDDMHGLLDRVTRTLSGVNNTATAEEALPVLEMVSEELDLIIKRLPNLTETGRAEIATEAARALPGLRDNARRINNSDGIDLLGPTLNTMVGQLSQML